MTAPTFAQLSDPTQGGPGFGPEPPAARLVTILSIIASGQYPDGSPVSGYASLTGAGQAATPGDLVQEGGFTVNDAAGDGINFNGTGGTTITDTSDFTATNGVNSSVEVYGSGGVLVSDASAGGVTIQTIGGGTVQVVSTSTGDIKILVGSPGSGRFIVDGIPTSDPHDVGVVWTNSGVLTRSSG